MQRKAKLVKLNTSFKVLGGSTIKRFYKLNRQIQAVKVRVIGEEREQVGVLPIAEAQKLADDRGVDLVEIAPNANPPVCRLVDFKKFKYEEDRKEKEARKKTKEVELKEVWLSPFISEHDLETRVGQIKKFLKNKDMVRLRLKFKPRQMNHTDFGFLVIEKIMKTLGNEAQIENEVKLQGRQITTILGPKRGTKDAESKNS